MTTTPLRVANCSGFFGDRLSAAREMVDDGPIDVLTGDWLAELTMGVLLKQRDRDPEAGYARTFLTQLEDVLANCLERGIRIVSNAGGLNPRACAAKVEQIASDLGRNVRVAVVDGDDATEVVRRAREDGWTAPHLDTGKPFDELAAEVDVASAYLGCWGIAEALQEGADIVITGRVSDASVIAGPGRLALRVGERRLGRARGSRRRRPRHRVRSPGHWRELLLLLRGPGARTPWLPAGRDRGRRVRRDHQAPGDRRRRHRGDGHGSAALRDRRAPVPQPRCRRTIRHDDPRAGGTGPGPDLGTRGEPAPDTVKVGLITTPGHRNSVTFVITGDDVPAKADLAQRALWAAVPGGEKAFDEVDVRLLRADRPDPAAPDEATALLTVSVASRDRSSVAQLARAAVETGLSSYPGFYLTAPPSSGSAYTVFWPTLLPATDFPQTVSFEGREWTAEARPPGPSRPLHPPPRPRRRDPLRDPLFARRWGQSWAPGRATRGATPRSGCGRATTAPTTG